ncbi:hypothetical protein AB0L75_35460 [Streptomyces sp. NPDC052101]|uniref:hypothetical protein n=1 Tax=Streptomyces sp. NPDC052101 TaxID=3155763 RepID=UPI00343EBD74
MTAPMRQSSGVGDLVRDTSRGREGVLTDVREGAPILRPRSGGGLAEEWPTSWAAVELIARRGTWEPS